MAKGIRENAISALLICSEKEGIPPKVKSMLLNVLSLKVLEITKDLEQVKCLLASEKGKIESRGTDLSAYMLDNGLSVSDILKSYYRHRLIDTEGNAQLDSNLMVSEYMLMLGVFSWLKEERNRQAKADEKEIHKVQKKINSTGWPAIKPLSDAEVKELESYIQDKSLQYEKERRMISYINQESRIILTEILNSLGTSFAQEPREHVTQIVKAAYSLTYTSKSVDCFMTNRSRRKPAVENDVAFFERMGESSSRLEEIMMPKEPDAKSKIYIHS